jgi:hypothetical protein
MDSGEIFLMGFGPGVFTGVVAAILFEFLTFLVTEFLKRRKRRVW